MAHTPAPHMARLPATRIDGSPGRPVGVGSGTRWSLAPRPCLFSKAVALIAHDGKKAELARFVARFRDRLEGVPIVATRTTGAMLEAAGFTVERVASGPEGGDVQIAARIVEGSIGSVIFFKDPMVDHPHAADIDALLRLCDVYDVPLATNQRTAELIVRGMRAAEGIRTTVPASPAGASAGR